jgi:hypothetical protein
MNTCRRLAYPNEIQLFASPMGGGHENASIKR